MYLMVSLITSVTSRIRIVFRAVVHPMSQGHVSAPVLLKMGNTKFVDGYFPCSGNEAGGFFLGVNKVVSQDADVTRHSRIRLLLLGMKTLKNRLTLRTQD